MAAPLMELRKKQIASLSNHGIVYTQIVPDSQYEIKLHTLNLRLVLPPAFPDIAPAIYVAQKQQGSPQLPITMTGSSGLSHPWLNQYGMIIGYDRLAQWNQHMSLGKLIADISTEFSIRPPSSSHSSPSNTPSRPPPPIPKQESPSYSSKLPFPDAAFPGLDSKSMDELNEMIEDETALDAFLKTMPRFKELLQLKVELIKGNADLSKQTISKEAEMAAVRIRVDSLCAKQQETAARLTKLLEDQQRQLMRFDSRHVVERMRVGITESEESTEKIVGLYLQGAISEDKFICQFKPVRKLYHRRAAKLERALNGGLLP